MVRNIRYLHITKQYFSVLAMFSVLNNRKYTETIEKNVKTIKTSFEAVMCLADRLKSQFYKAKAEN